MPLFPRSGRSTAGDAKPKASGFPAKVIPGPIAGPAGLLVHKVCDPPLDAQNTVARALGVLPDITSAELIGIRLCIVMGRRCEGA